MNMLIEELQSLSGQPGAWAVVACMVLVALHSLIGLSICPIARGTHTVEQDDITRARGQLFMGGPRFFATMVMGIGVLLIGLFMIADGIHPTLALALLVIGLVIVQTEPVRLRIREGQNRVIASHDTGGEAVTVARQRLVGSHRELILTNMTLAAGLIAALLAF